MERVLRSVEERQVRAGRRFTRVGFVFTALVLLAVPAFALLVPPPAIYAGPLLAGWLAALLLHGWRIRRHVRALGETMGAVFVSACAVLGLALALLGLASSPLGYIWAIVSAVLLGDIVAGRRARWIAVWVLSATAVVLGLGLWIGSLVVPDGAPFWLTPAIAAGYVATIWCVDVERLWWFKAVVRLDDSRRTAAELATARERLRLADDLHDILGHALEVVAFKSELAARLSSADPDRAGDEMDEVQRVARESLSEVRSLVRERRPTDLTAELASARTVLESSGVELTVTGDPQTVDVQSRDVLGRVLREAVTNVLRHAHATRCSVELDRSATVTTLRIVNDGATCPDGNGSGTGLAAVSRYLTERSGTLDAGPQPDGGFQLCATLPVTQTSVALA